MALYLPGVRKIIACLGVSALTAALGGGYSFVSGGLIPYGALAGFLIGLLLGAFELFVVRSRPGRWLRRMPLMLLIMVETVTWAVIIGFSIYIATPLLLGLEVDLRTFSVRDAYGVSFAFGIAFLSIFYLRIQSLIGERVLFNFLIGRYNKPVRDERVFMFLDIADSTHLAEEFGDVKIQALIGRFFFDIARPIAEHGGEIYRYIGDEVVVSWRMADAIEDACCVRCVFAVCDVLNACSEEYRRSFGVVPRFRVGMHGGPVVVGEVGDSRRAIVYFGETVSCAVALQVACKRIRRDFLMSGGLFRRLSLGDDYSADFVGSLELFSGGKTVDTYALSRNRTVDSRLPCR